MVLDETATKLLCDTSTVSIAQDKITILKINRTPTWSGSNSSNSFSLSYLQ